MHIKQEYAKRFLDTTSEKFSKNGVGNFIDTEAMEHYKRVLQDIANRRKYEEGQAIDQNDLEAITTTVKSVLDNMKAGMEKHRDSLQKKEKANYNPHSSMVAASDHLFAIAMDTLGCPDMPAQFGPTVTSHIDSISAEAEFLVKQEIYNKSSDDRRYREQRGLNANKVHIKNLEHGKEIISKKASPLTIATYAAEYHALKKRQEGHGKIWIFFHKKENELRTKLLANMKKILNGAVGDGIDIDNSTSKEIAEYYNKSIVEAMSKEAFKEDAISKRNKIPYTFFSNEPKVNNNLKEKNEKEVIREEIKNVSEEIVHQEEEIKKEQIAIPSENKKFEEKENVKNNEVKPEIKKQESAPENDDIGDAEYEEEIDNYEEELDKSLKTLPAVPEVDFKLSCTENGNRIMGSQRFMAEFKKEVLNIISYGKPSSSMDKRKVAEAVTNSIINNAKRINDAYDAFANKEISQSGFESKMNNFMEDMFKDTFDAIGKNGAGLMVHSRLVAAQRISNLMLNKATAVAFKDDELELYSHNFVMNDDGILQSVAANQAGTLTMVQKIMDSARKEMAEFEKVSIVVDEADFFVEDEVSEKVTTSPAKAIDMSKK